MNVVWIAGAIAILAVIARSTAKFRFRRRESDMGFVSQQWIAEHRLTQSSDTSR